MSEDIQETRFNQNGEYQEDAAYNIESYSEESGDPESDPFTGHYGNLKRQIQGFNGRYYRTKPSRSAVHRKSKTSQ